VNDWEAWRAHRLSALRAEDGPPALVATYWLDETDSVPGVDGTWLDGRDVVLRLASGEELLALEHGSLFGPRLRFDRVTVEVSNRGGRRGVRVFDHARAGSTTVDAFPPDACWIVRGTFAPHEGATRSYQREGAGPIELPTPGTVSFELEGRTYETRPYAEEGGLLLVFRDATTGTATKPPGRFLLIPAPSGGAVELDFNRAYLPPCAFSDQFSCPLPPPEHRLEAAVTAGETWPARA
jgi:uncharacterized protein (DUF1684 family)